jgi:hypothetical protein
MSTEIIVALIAATGASGTIGAFTAYLTARRTARVQAKAAEDEFLGDRDKLLWEQAGKFWDQRAATLTNQVETERAARIAGALKLEADLALLALDNVELKRARLECEDSLRTFREGLVSAGETLLALKQAKAELKEAKQGLEDAK